MPQLSGTPVLEKAILEVALRKSDPSLHVGIKALYESSVAIVDV